MTRQKVKILYEQLDELFASAEELSCTGRNKFVVFSDLHMGDGSTKDDFKRNADLFQTSLEKYYLKKDFYLILNGDVEELQRFSYNSIRKQWDSIYAVFENFNRGNKLFKLVGNHDLQLLLPSKRIQPFKILHSVRLKSKAGDLLIFHGHQASRAYKKLNKLIEYSLRYIANPLRIKNYSVAHDSRKQYAIEKRVFQYSNFRKIVSVIGHTHRPLFESLSNAERLKFKIEQLCREYSNTSDEQKAKPIKKLIKSHKKELQKIYRKNNRPLLESNLYDSKFHIPCLFNSGCVIGKRGMTCLEVDSKSIALVHWFDKKSSQKYLGKKGYEPKQLEGSDYYRMVINKENLKYIFSRINLLS